MLIVIEGTDGSGKATQTQMLSDKLRKEGFRVDSMAFPQYKKSHGAELVSRYLAGEFGNLNPYAASMFYALDRAEHRAMLLTKLMANDIVICDRYVWSNMAHQSARVGDAERGRLIEFIEWLEFEHHQMPRPQMTILLRTTPSISEKNRAGRETTDQHESDTNHQTTALQQYVDLAESRGWSIVNTFAPSGEQRSPEAIASECMQLIIRQKLMLGTIERGYSVQDLASVIFGEAMETNDPGRKNAFIGAARRAVEFLSKAWEKPAG